jgi:hypothetical protein
MKIFSVLIFSCSLIFGEHIRWRSDYENSLIEAKRVKKDILLLVLKKECIKCKTIFTEIFDKDDIRKSVNEKYIPIIVFFEDKNSYPIELFYTQFFPTLFFVSSKDESFLQKPLFGSFTQDELLQTL